MRYLLVIALLAACAGTPPATAPHVTNQVTPTPTAAPAPIFEIREVVHDAPESRALFKAIYFGPGDTGIEAEAQYWRDEEGEDRVDFALIGESPAIIEAAVAALIRDHPELAPAPGRVRVYQRIPPTAAGAPRFQSYLVEADPVVEMRHVVDAAATFDDIVGRWHVTLTFDDDGRERFARATREHVGDKLVLLVDGTVSIAPVIMSEVSGGKLDLAIDTALGLATRERAEGLAARIRRRD